MSLPSQVHQLACLVWHGVGETMQMGDALVAKFKLMLHFKVFSPEPHGPRLLVGQFMLGFWQKRSSAPAQG
jgi:hypothetical protein